MHACMQTGRQADRQTGRQTDIAINPLKPAGSRKIKPKSQYNEPSISVTELHAFIQ